MVGISDLLEVKNAEKSAQLSLTSRLRKPKVNSELLTIATQKKSPNNSHFSKAMIIKHTSK